MDALAGSMIGLTHLSGRAARQVFFSSLGCGRKRFRLDARIGELSGTLRRLGLQSRASYDGGGISEQVPIINDKDELVPYRALDLSRLKLSGTGSWDR